ncbi:MAG: hypothetical protein JWM19_4748 [Actinomycetia bacterium]|nr:hypothetical protein [Actinomycetes bacterium]
MTLTASPAYDPRLYVQIATDLRAKLHAGTVTAGTTLHIAHLASQWGTARPTASKALRTLENDGLIRHYPRYGYLVLPQGPPPGKGPSPVGATAG